MRGLLVVGDQVLVWETLEGQTVVTLPIGARCPFQPRMLAVITSHGAETPVKRKPPLVTRDPPPPRATELSDPLGYIALSVIYSS